jgi:hypothetical protein
MRRGMFPPERQVIIENAEENAQKRKEIYHPVRL